MPSPSKTISLHFCYLDKHLFEKDENNNKKEVDVFFDNNFFLYREKCSFPNSCVSHRHTIINQYLSVIKEKNISDIKHIPVSSFQRIIINNSKKKYMPKSIKIPEGLS